MVDVRTVNLHQKGIWEIDYIEDGHRMVKMVHAATKTETIGNTRQEAFDKLMEQL